MAASILVIEDDKVLNRLIAQQLEEVGHRVTSAYRWATANQYLARHEPNLVILDCRLPDIDGHSVIPELAKQQPLIVITAYGSVKSAVQAMKAGAADYLTKPVHLDELELSVGRVLENAALRQDHQFYSSQMRALHNRLMVGRSKPMEQVNALIDAVAPSDITVLIQGESGVGKELVAHEIHRRSPRSARHFVTLDCCCLQQTLFESELFGHERGAFTGADCRKQGLIEGAAGGTLFLDEIGDIDHAVQAKLLRVLESGEYRRLGSTKELTADVRIIAATNQNPEALVRNGCFRSDLFFRVSRFVIPVPPLRERREDIPELVRHFIEHHDSSCCISKRVSSATIQQLFRYDWPGNVRELKNVVERAIILSGTGPDLRPECFTFASYQPQPVAPSAVSLTFPNEPSLEEIERHYLSLLFTKLKFLDEQRKINL